MKVKVNDHYDFDVKVAQNTVMVNDVVLEIDSRDLSASQKHLIYLHKSYNIELVDTSADQKHCTVKVNGTLYQIAIEDQYDTLLMQLGMDNAVANKVLEIKAPMPGLVLSILGAEGQEVSKGDSLLVLEAMKMENIIKSPTGGAIKKILIHKGDKVEKNEILIQFA